MEISKKKLFFATIKYLISDYGFFIVIMLSTFIFIIKNEQKILVYIFALIVYSIALTIMIFSSIKTARYRLTDSYYSNLLKNILNQINDKKEYIERQQEIMIRENFYYHININVKKIRGCNCIMWKECPELYQDIVQDMLDEKEKDCTECGVFQLKKEIEVLTKEALDVIDKRDRIKDEAWKYL